MTGLASWIRLTAATAVGVLIGAAPSGKLNTRELKHYAASEIMSSLPLADDGPVDKTRFVIWTVDPAKNTFNYVAEPRNERRIQLVIQAMDTARTPLKTSLRVLSAKGIAAVGQAGRSAIVPMGDGPSPGLAGTAPLNDFLKFQDDNVPVVEDVPVEYRQALSLRFWQPGQRLASVVTLKPRKTPLGIIGDVECTGWWPVDKGSDNINRKVSLLFPDGQWGLISPTSTSPVIAVRVTE